MNPNCHQRNEVGKATFMRGKKIFMCHNVFRKSRAGRNYLDEPKKISLEKREHGVNISNLKNFALKP